MRPEIVEQLTWADIREIVKVADEVFCMDDEYKTEEEFYGKILSELNPYHKILRGASGHIINLCIEDMQNGLPITIYTKFGQKHCINNTKELEEYMFSANNIDLPMYYKHEEE